MGVVLAMHQIDMIMEPEEYLFFAGRPQALALLLLRLARDRKSVV